MPMEKLKTKRVLIAEDETMLGEMLRVEVSERGPAVTLARNGEEAIEHLRHDTPDMLLLDLLMPKKSGYDVLQYLLDHKIDVPVVVLSNLSEPKEMDRCRALGALDFLIKSHLDPEQLWSKIERYLR